MFTDQSFATIVFLATIPHNSLSHNSHFSWHISLGTFPLAHFPWHISLGTFFPWHLFPFSKYRNQKHLGRFLNPKIVRRFYEFEATGVKFYKYILRDSSFNSLPCVLRRQHRLVIMFVDPDASIPEQPIDFKCARPIPETLSAGGLDRYINITLAQKFSELALDDAISTPQRVRGAPMFLTEERHADRQVLERSRPRQRLKSLTRSNSDIKGRRYKRTTPFAISMKRDLTPAQIRLIASSLIEEDAPSFLLENRHFIYQTWTSITLLATNTNINDSIGAAFDTVHSLIQSKKCSRLVLRFAFIHLKRLIDTLETQTKAGYIETYLNAKKNLLHLSGRQLIEYARKSRRWSMLAGPSPFQLSVYSILAETIMYVPSYI